MGVAPSPAAATPGLVRSDPHGPGISRVRGQAGFRYLDPSGAEVTEAGTLDRIRALRIPPAWTGVWISADPLGHIQATGVDAKGRTQYLYHQLWRDQRDAQKFSHMLRFATALPDLRTATVGDLGHRGLQRDRVAAGVVRLIDLGLFRVGGEKYAELDHHYGATTLEKRHVRLTRDGILFDYVAKAGKQRTITVRDPVVQPVVRALLRQDTGLDELFAYQHGDGWHILHSHQVNEYIAGRAGGHFTAKEFRTWNASLLMALTLADAGPTADRASAAGGGGQRAGRGPLAGRHPGGGPRLVHRPGADRPVRVRGRAGRDPGRAAQPARPGRGRAGGGRAAGHPA